MAKIKVKLSMCTDIRFLRFYTASSPQIFYKYIPFNHLHSTYGIGLLTLLCVVHYVLLKTFCGICIHFSVSRGLKIQGNVFFPCLLSSLFQ